MDTFLPFTEGTTSFFFSTGASCVATVTGLCAALAMFHYQNITQRIIEKRNYLFDKYDAMGAGLTAQYQEKYQSCRSIEETVDFWAYYFKQENKDSHAVWQFDELYGLLKQTHQFRNQIVRIALYGFFILLPVGVIGTLEPIFGLNPKLRFLNHTLFAVFLVGYFGMCFTLTRSAFVVLWKQRKF